MKQTEKLNNACSIIACLHVIFNNMGLIGIREGSTLDEFTAKKETGEAVEEILANDEEIHVHHEECNEQAQSDPANGTGHHFVAYIVNSKNQLVELDGQSDCPKLVKDNCEPRSLFIDCQAYLKTLFDSGHLDATLSIMTLNYS